MTLSKHKIEKCEALYERLTEAEEQLRKALSEAYENFSLSVLERSSDGTGLGQEIRSAICSVGIAQRRIKEYRNQ